MRQTSSSQGRNLIFFWQSTTFYVTGDFEGEATFGPDDPSETTLIAGGFADIFIARFNPDGTLAWAKSALGSDNADHSYEVAASSDGSNWISGEFDGFMIFGQGEPGQRTLISSGDQDVFVAKHNGDGSFAWASRGGGTGNDEARSTERSPNGSILVAGNFMGSAVFGEGEPGQITLTSRGGDEEIFLASYNEDGTLAWATMVGVGKFGSDSTIFGSGQPFETSLTSVGGHDIFVARYWW